MASTMKKSPDVTLNEEIKLQVNKTLFEKGVISREIYEAAKVRIVNGT